jgi:hypothetical protein
MPRGEFQRTYFQEKLLPEFDERLIIDFVNPTPSDPDFLLKAAQAEPQTLRINEWRDLQGLDDLDDGSGELFLVKSMGMKAIESFEEVQQDEADLIAPLDPFGQPGAPAEEPEDDPPEDDDPEEEDPKEEDPPEDE